MDSNTPAAILPHNTTYEVNDLVIKLRLRISDSARDVRRGIISKDGLDFGNGAHVALYEVRETTSSQNQRLMLRFQNQDSSSYLCSPPLARNSWHDVETQVGASGAKLWVDGQPSVAGTFVWNSSNPLFPCSTTSVIRPMSSNTNPWVIGGDSEKTEPGNQPRGANLPAAGVLIDHIVIRDLTSLP